MAARLPPLEDILELVPDAVCVVDPEGRFLFVSGSFERIFGYARDEVLGKRTFDLVHPDDREATMRQAELVMTGTLQRHFRNRYLHKDGHAVDVQWSARWLPDYGVRIAVGHEVTELRRAERELEHLAAHDVLTGLPNRRQLGIELRKALEHARATDGALALLFIDLDGFKQVNDRGGHGAGDMVLRQVAYRLGQGLREDDLVARVGGDEFVALLPGCRRPADVERIAADVRERLHRLYALPDGVYRLQASIGIARFPDDAQDADGLMAHADRAMYAVKRERREAG